MSVTFQLADDIDISRGDMIVKPDNIPYVAQEFDAMICWMHDDPLRKGIKYGIKLGTRSARCMVSDIQHRVNIDTLEPESGAPSLGLNEIGRVKIKTTVPMMFDPYNRNRVTGGFIVVDEATNLTMGAGMILEPKRPVPGQQDDAEFII
jgi:bifunctional enzyme CysN/CysC